jgi:hypothetical protein
VKKSPIPTAIIEIEGRKAESPVLEVWAFYFNAKK